MAKVMEIKDLAVRTMEADIKEIHCKDGTVRLRVMDYQAKHQFAGILKNENVLPEEVAEKKAEILEKIRQMEYRLDFPDFDDIIYETDDSVSGGLKIAHEMNGKVGTTGAQYCYLFRRIHSLLDEIRRDERIRGVLDTVKEYDQKRGKILEWEETAEGWKNEYMTIPDDDSVVKGWGVCRPYQMRTFCETVKRETVKEAMRNLEKFRQEEQQEIAKKAFAEVFRETHRSLEIDFEQESASVVIKMVSDEEYICACAFYGTGEWKYPEASIKEAYEDGLRFYKEVKSRKDQMDRSVDVKELYGFAIGMKESFEKGLITEEHYNRFVQMGRELVRQVDSLAKGNAAYGLYVRYAVEYGLEEPDYRQPKTREQAVAVLELMKNTFEMFPELEKDGKMYSFYHGQLAGVGEKAFYAEKSEMRER